MESISSPIRPLPTGSWPIRSISCAVMPTVMNFANPPWLIEHAHCGVAGPHLLAGSANNALEQVLERYFLHQFQAGPVQRDQPFLKLLSGQEHGVKDTSNCIISHKADSFWRTPAIQSGAGLQNHA